MGDVPNRSTDTQEVSVLNTQAKLCLKSWGLPASIVDGYAEKGIHEMFPWQVECLTKDGVLAGRNLVYTAPTSAGKTMVAEILMMKTVLERKKKVLFILPFVSVVREKVHYFQKLYKGVGIKVDGWMGSYSPPGGVKMVNVMIATIEKANGIINRLIEENKLGVLGCIVVDELHMLGDPARGYLLELLLTKLKYMQHRNKDVQIQLVGMSATLPNLNVLANWLDAILFYTTFRPIPLVEHIVLNSQVFTLPDMTAGYQLKSLLDLQGSNEDVMYLCLDSILNSHSVLIFCPTKNWCETLAIKISALIKKMGLSNTDMASTLRSLLDPNTLSDVIQQLTQCPAGLDMALKRSISFGVGFHHAGLTMNERDIVECAFRKGIIKVLVSTSTLSSGVNLPARRVILRSPRHLDILTYKQMVGRAGRMGKDTAGESYLLCDKAEENAAKALVLSSIPPVQSCLGKSDISDSLKRAILEVIACGIVRSIEDAILYTECTLFSATSKSTNVLECIDSCIEYLRANHFLLLSELSKARQCFVLDSELHIIYEITPYSVSEQWGELDWMRCLQLWENLPPSCKRVAELVGCGQVEFLHKILVKPSYAKSPAGRKVLSVFKRFYTALALQDIVNEMSLTEVAAKYACNKGMLQSLQQSASTFAGMVTQFCRKLGWSGFEPLVSQFCARLEFGVQAELVSLLQIDLLNSLQARALYDAGFESLSDVANACVSDIVRVLNVGAFGENVFLSGEDTLSEVEAAIVVINSARRLIEQHLGVENIEWNNRNLNESEVTYRAVTPQIRLKRNVGDTPAQDGREESESRAENVESKAGGIKQKSVHPVNSQPEIIGRTEQNIVRTDERNAEIVDNSVNVPENAGGRGERSDNSVNFRTEILNSKGGQDNPLNVRSEVVVEINRSKSLKNTFMKTHENIQNICDKTRVPNVSCPKVPCDKINCDKTPSQICDNIPNTTSDTTDNNINISKGSKCKTRYSMDLFNESTDEISAVTVLNPSVALDNREKPTSKQNNLNMVNRIEDNLENIVDCEENKKREHQLSNHPAKEISLQEEYQNHNLNKPTEASFITKTQNNKHPEENDTQEEFLQSKVEIKYNNNSVEELKGNGLGYEKDYGLKEELNEFPQGKAQKRLSLDPFDSSGDEDVMEDKIMCEDLNKPINEFDANLGGESLLEMSLRNVSFDLGNVSYNMVADSENFTPTNVRGKRYSFVSSTNRVVNKSRYSATSPNNGKLKHSTTSPTNVKAKKPKSTSPNGTAKSRYSLRRKTGNLSPSKSKVKANQVGWKRKSSSRSSSDEEVSIWNEFKRSLTLEKELPSRENGSPARKKESPLIEKQLPVLRKELPTFEKESSLTEKGLLIKETQSPILEKASLMNETQSPTLEKESLIKETQSTTLKKDVPRLKQDLPSIEKELIEETQEQSLEKVPASIEIESKTLQTPHIGFVRDGAELVEDTLLTDDSKKLVINEVSMVEINDSQPPNKQEVQNKPDLKQKQSSLNEQTAEKPPVNADIVIEDSLFDSSFPKNTTVRHTAKQNPQVSPNEKSREPPEDLFLKPEVLPLKKTKPFSKQNENPTNLLRTDKVPSDSVLFNASFPSATLLENQVLKELNVKSAKCKTESSQIINLPARTADVMKTAEVLAVNHVDAMIPVCKDKRKEEPYLDSPNEDSTVIDSSISHGSINNTKVPIVICTSANKLKPPSASTSVSKFGNPSTTPKSRPSLGFESQFPNISAIERALNFGEKPSANEESNDEYNEPRETRRAKASRITQKNKSGTESKEIKNILDDKDVKSNDSENSTLEDSKDSDSTSKEVEGTISHDKFTNKDTKCKQSTKDLKSNNSKPSEAEDSKEEESKEMKKAMTKNTKNEQCKNSINLNFEESMDIELEDITEIKHKGSVNTKFQSSKDTKDIKSKITSRTNKRQPTGRFDKENKGIPAMIDLTLESEDDFIEDDLCNVSQTSYNKHRTRQGTTKRNVRSELKSSSSEDFITDEEIQTNFLTVQQSSKTQSMKLSNLQTSRTKTHQKRQGISKATDDEGLTIENSSSDEDIEPSKRFKSDTCIARSNRNLPEDNKVHLVDRKRDVKTVGNRSNKHLSSEDSKVHLFSESVKTKTHRSNNHLPSEENKAENKDHLFKKDIEALPKNEMETSDDQAHHETIDSISVLVSSNMCTTTTRLKPSNRTPTQKIAKLTNTTPAGRTAKPTNTTPQRTGTQRRKSLSPNDISSLENIGERFKLINQSLFSDSPGSSQIRKRRIPGRSAQKCQSPRLHNETVKRKLDTNPTLGEKKRKLNNEEPLVTNLLNGIVFNDTAVSFCNVLNKPEDGVKENDRLPNRESNRLEVSSVRKTRSSSRTNREEVNATVADGISRQQANSKIDAITRKESNTNTLNEISTKSNIDTRGSSSKNAINSEEINTVEETLGCDGTITQYEKANKYHADLIELFKNNRENPNDTYILQQLSHIDQLTLSFKVVQSAESDVIGTRFMKKSSTSGGLKYKGKELALMYIVWNNDVAYYVDFKQAEHLGLKLLSSIVTNPKFTIYMFNAKVTSVFLYRSCNISVEAKVVDPGTVDWLITPSTEPRPLRKIVISHFRDNSGLCNMFGSLLNQSAEEALVLWKLRPFLETKLGQMNLWNHFIDVEMPIQQILTRCELQGLGFNSNHITDLNTKCTQVMVALEKQMYELAGQSFNVRSPKEWAKVKTKLNLSQHPDHPIVQIRRHWNQLDSLQSRCLNHLLLKTISDDLSGRRIHTQFSTHTQTGRIFTVKPNLQTTPKQLTIRGVDFDPRNAFVAAEGCVLICADFKQIELRVLTHLSQDNELKTAIESEDDVFKSIASQWHRRPLAEITEDTRTQTKSIVYAIIYGMGPRTLAAKLDLSLEEAADLYVSFKRKYADIETFCNRVVADCRQNGYVRTLCGRRRYIEDINASDNKAKAAAERQAVNTCIQGSAADIVKAAMIKTDALLCASQPRCRLVLQVHDELIYEVPKSDASQACSLIREGMENCVQLSLQFPIAIKTGSAWGNVQSI
ncbi:hypothetical protein M8J76_004718 [Diaphorina citri]|nr:hypothetical protein M8J76_004718 [Diaphorina citri]